ncbi:hypothetical protein SMICM17S_07536 [Streptomyces microflavus]
MRAVQGADNFVEWFFKADRGELEPFVLVVEGSIPNERIKPEGYWCGFGDDPETGQPITTSEWLDRLTPKALAVVAIGTCATYGGIHAMAGNPTGAMGVPDYLGWEWKSKAGIPIVCIPGCPVHPDNASETLLYLLYQAAGAAPMIPLDEELRPTWLFGATVHEGCEPALSAGPVRRRVRLPAVPGQARLLGPGRQVQRTQARLDQRRRRLPQRRRHLHRLHHAGLPRQVHAVHGRATRRPRLRGGERRVRLRHPPAAPLHREDGRQGTEVAHQDRHHQDRLPGRRGDPRPGSPGGGAQRASGADLPEGRRGTMATATGKPAVDADGLMEMSWDPITRIVGRLLGIHTKIDFAAKRVAECYSTSSIFRGYSVFMKGKDPRDAHFITSRICGICGDNHATCSVYAQNMAYGVAPLGESMSRMRRRPTSSYPGSAS